jgi:hypothetical protein
VFSFGSAALRCGAELHSATRWEKPTRGIDPTPRRIQFGYLFSGVRPSSGAAGLGAGETWQSSGVFGVETLLLPRTAALLALTIYKFRAPSG